MMERIATATTVLAYPSFAAVVPAIDPVIIGVPLSNTAMGRAIPG